MWNQHLKLFTGRPEINIFELMCLMKLTFCCFLTESTSLLSCIKGTQSALPPHWPGHYFPNFEKSSPQPEIKVTHQVLLKIHFNPRSVLLNFQSLPKKTVFECAFVHPMILFYRIWLKTVSITSPKEHEEKTWEMWRLWAEEITFVGLGCLWLTAMPQFSCLFGTQCTSACGLSTWYPDCIQFFP